VPIAQTSTVPDASPSLTGAAASAAPPSSVSLRPQLPTKAVIAIIAANVRTVRFMTVLLVDVNLEAINCRCSLTLKIFFQ
jgi:hypothetical protein